MVRKCHEMVMALKRKELPLIDESYEVITGIIRFLKNLSRKIHILIFSLLSHAESGFFLSLGDKMQTL